MKNYLKTLLAEKQWIEEDISKKPTSLKERIALGRYRTETALEISRVKTLMKRKAAIGMLADVLGDLAKLLGQRVEELKKIDADLEDF